MKENKKFEVLFSEEVNNFLESINVKAKLKILYNIALIQGGLINRELFKKLEGTEIWELRTMYAGMAYRILAFFDTERNALIVTTHGFIKKTQKTPQREIEKAKAIKTEYIKSKKH